jgi:membrane-associated phospholipid phosphatase
MALEPRTLLRAAAGCAAAFVVLLLLAYTSDGARWLDASALQGFLGLQRPQVTPFTDFMMSLGDPAQVALIACGIALLALARGRPRVAIFVFVLVAVTSVSSQVLKAVLAYPRYDGRAVGAFIGPEAFPSGHSTAAMALAIALVVAVPPRLRLVAAAVGTAFALGVSLSTISTGGHFPSDVAGGYLLAGGWALVLLAGLRASQVRFPERTGRTRLALLSGAIAERVAVVGLLALLGAALLALTAVAVAGLVFKLPDLVGYARDHTAFVTVLVALVVGAATLLAGMAGALSRRT